jgi:Family of unknown function (DUF6167)
VSRVFWFAIGAGSGVYAAVKTRRAAQRLTPQGLSDHIGAAGVGLRQFADEVREGMAEKETRLRQQLGLPDPGHHPRTELPTGAGEKGVA